MKKLLVILLAFGMIFSFAACGGDDTTSNTSSSQVSKSEETSKKETSKAVSKAESEEASSEAASGTAETSGDATTPEFTNKFVSFGTAVSTTVTADDTTSIRLTKINEAPVAGDIVLFTNDYGATIAAGSETYADYAILVCTYHQDVFGYTKTSLKEVGDDSTKASTKIPEDGFVVAVHKTQETDLSHLSNIKDTDKFFVHGIQIGDVSISLTKATKTPTIDGSISATEYGAAKWKVDENNELWDYSQFEAGNYYASAEVYATYDDTNLYLGVIVDSPNHYCPISEADAGSMWQYECIQVNVCSVDPLGDYISEHFDYVKDSTAPTDNVVRQYGFAASDDNETLSCVWIGTPATYTGTAVCKRDDVNEKTYYEVAIPWTEIGSTTQPFDISTAKTIGFSVSVNSTSKDDAGKNVWKNIMMRDGGGIILRNDFSKIASVTLG